MLPYTLCITCTFSCLDVGYLDIFMYGYVVLYDDEKQSIIYFHDLYPRDKFYIYFFFFWFVRSFFIFVETKCRYIKRDEEISF